MSNAISPLIAFTFHRLSVASKLFAMHIMANLSGFACK
jgi:hypothetical protein